MKDARKTKAQLIREVEELRRALADAQARQTGLASPVAQHAGYACAEEELRERVRQMRLVKEVAAAANTAVTLEHVFRVALEDIVRYTGWEVGHVYLATTDAPRCLVSSEIWHLTMPERYRSFVEASRDFTFPIGTGLPGRVLASRQAAWVQDIMRDENFLRTPCALDAGLRAAFAFPVLVAGEAAAVLEFFSGTPQEPDESFMAIMDQIGAQLGVVIERKRAEEALRSHLTFLTTLLDTIPSPVFYHDAQGRYLGCNTAFAHDILGLPVERIIGRTIREMGETRPPDLTVQYHQQDQEMPQGLPSYVYETAVQCADGVQRQFIMSTAAFSDGDGQLAGSIGVMVDISARVAAEGELRKLSRAIEQSPASVVVTDRDGTIEYVNPKFTEVTGYLLEDAIGKNPGILNSGVQSKAYYAEMWAEILAGHEWHGEFCNKRRNGEFYWESASISPIRNANGDITHFVAVKEDITERKRIAEELRLAKDAAEAASRAKSTFLANMSHEIRTPMNAILGFAQLMQRDASLPPEHRRSLETIARSGEHLLALINDILEMSRIEAGRVRVTRSSVDLHGLLDDLTMMFTERTHAKGLRFLRDTRDEAPRYIETDESKLRQILINLLGNAVKFTAAGSITLRVAARARNGGNLRLVVEVEDTGVGIAAHEIGRLFQYFEQTSSGARQEGGTGLGLAISREFARLLGGDITVSSQEGVGSTFRLEIPVRAGHVTAVYTPKQRGRIRALQPGQSVSRVLVVDDRNENRLILTKMLEMVGFETCEAVNGEKAVAAVAELHPALVLMDTRMPVMDGYEAIRRIRATVAGRKTPIIAVTASVFPEDRQQAFEAGADDFIGKPYREQDLLETIAKHLGVSYHYDDDAPSGNPRPTVNREAVSLLPAALVEKLRTATVNADMEWLLALIDDAEALAPPVAAALRRLVDEFAYEALLQYLDRGEQKV